MASDRNENTNKRESGVRIELDGWIGTPNKSAGEYLPNCTEDGFNGMKSEDDEEESKGKLNFVQGREKKKKEIERGFFEKYIKKTKIWKLYVIILKTKNSKPTIKKY